MNQQKIGAFIRDVRKENGLTQEQFAEKLGVSQKSISRWETGKTMPDYSLLPAICEILGVNIAELLGAEYIDGDYVSKRQVTLMAHNMISFMNDKKNVRKIIGVILSIIITLSCVVGLYRLEYNVSAESTTDLEKAINEYNAFIKTSADVLEMQAMKNHLYVLYGQREYPGACGLACLEKGILGNYRIISCDNTGSRWINIKKITVGKTTYCVSYCVNTFPSIDAYGICGVNESIGPNLTVEDSYLLYKNDYIESPFLHFYEIDKDVVVSPFYIKYYSNNKELPEEKLEIILGEHFVEDAPNAGGGTAELGLFYVLESIIILLGIIFIRFFLVDDTFRRKELE